MKSQVDLHRMRLTIEVARRRSISAAARSLGVSQPALTRSIADIESELGVELFVRSPQGVEVTEDGERFIAGAVRILGDVESLVSEFPSEDGPLSGMIRVGVCPSGYTAFTEEAVTRIARSHPAVHITLHEGSAELLCPRLLYGELDLIVGLSSYLDRWRELNVKHVKRLYSVCVVRLDHPLGKLNRVEEEDVLSYPAILPSSVDPAHSDLAARHTEHGLPPFHPQYATDDYDLILKIVRDTDGYFPAMVSDSVTNPFENDYLTFSEVLKIPKRYISIVLPPNREGTRLARLFEQYFIDSLE